MTRLDPDGVSPDSGRPAAGVDVPPGPNGSGGASAARRWTRMIGFVIRLPAGEVVAGVWE